MAENPYPLPPVPDDVEPLDPDDTEDQGDHQSNVYPEGDPS